MAPKHLLIENAEARRRRHVPSTEEAPASRRDAYLQQAAELKLAHGEEDAVEQVVEIDNSEPDLSPEEVSLLERAAVEAQEQAAINEDRPHTAEEAAAPIIRALPAHLLNSTVVINRNSYGKVLQSVDRSCPAGWVAYLDTCFYFYSSSYTGTWDTCDSLCKSNTPGSQMLCVTDSAQNNFLTASAKSRGISRLWIGMQRDSSGKLQWGSSCNSYYYNWDTSMAGVNKYAASKTDSDGKWFDAGPQPYFCACQNTFSAPSVRPTAQPSSTRAPLNRPTAPPTMLVTTSRPSSAPNTRPINLPRRVIPKDISAIANAIVKFMGCKADNKCDNYFLWYDTLDAPFFPVLTASGNDKFPCVYSSGMDVPVPVPVIPVIEIGVEAGLEIAFCNDLSGLDYVYGSVGVSVGITGLADLPTPFGAVFSYQVANVGIGFTFYVSEQWCSVQNGIATYSSNEAYGLLRHVANTAKGPDICRCLERGQTYPGLMFGVGGPDIPGLIFAGFPPFFPLAPFLAFTRITNSASLENFPDVCSLSISSSSMTIDLVIDLAFYSYSVNVFSYEMSMAHKSGAAEFIGAMMDKPRGLDAFLDEKGFSDRYLEGPFSKAGDKMKKILDANAAVWIAVVQLGGELANSAKNYFNKGVEEGKILASAAGSLYRLFKPPAVVVYGCFNPHISEPECARKIKLFGKRRCIAWHMPKISCGSTSKCIKYC